MMMMQVVATVTAATSSPSCSATTTSSPWTMLVSQYVAFGSVPDLGLHQDDDDDTDENAMPSTWFPFDNTSNNYCHNSYWSSGSPNYGDSNATCPRTTLLWSILRGMKRILARVANSYYAMPVVLFVMPLLIGLVVGICLGRRWERNMERMHRDKQPTMKSRRGRLRTFQQKVPWLWHWLWSLAPLQWIIPTRLNQEKESTVGANNDKALSEAATTTNTSTTTLDQTIDKESSVIVVDEEKDELARARLRREEEYETRESGVALELVPKHVAVIMDGNRRYGRAKYHNATQGHRDGSERLVDFAKWCCIEGVQVLTVFAFSTENWQRDPSEVAALMQLFCQYCDELRVEALQRNIQLRVLSSDETKIPAHVKAGLDRMEVETRHCHGGLTMNICLSYGSRGEILNACKSLIRDVQSHQIPSVDAIREDDLQRRLLTSHCGDPDVLLRTSGEVRLSNFLLWQSAYTEFFFLPHSWPEVTKADLLHVLRTYARERQRRFGK